MKNYLLLIIDSQLGIDEGDHWGGNRNNSGAEENISTLLHSFRRLMLPVIHVRHASKDPSSPFFPAKKGFRFKSLNEPLPNETIVQKSTPDAFLGTTLEEKIKSFRAEEVIIVGFVTNNSVEATARTCGNLNFKTMVVSNATAAFDKTGVYGEKYAAELVHTMSLANLNGEYAKILSTADVLKTIGGY